MSAENIINNWKLTDITFGEGTLNKAGSTSSDMGMKHALICIGGGSVEKFGYLSTLINALDKSGIKCY